MKHVRVRNFPRFGGWTLIELLMVVVILSILATLSFPLNAYFRKRGEQAVCIGNLRILHNGALGYLQDHDMIWPQKPAAFEDEHDTWKWWYETLKKYEVRQDHWLCPADRQTADQKKKNPERHASSYIPTEFDSFPNTAFRWSSQPWFMERGQNHGKGQGANILMPDGSVRQGPSMEGD